MSQWLIRCIYTTSLITLQPSLFAGVWWRHRRRRAAAAYNECCAGASVAALEALVASRFAPRRVRSCRAAGGETSCAFVPYSLPGVVNWPAASIRWFYSSHLVIFQARSGLFHSRVFAPLSSIPPVLLPNGSLPVITLPPLQQQQQLALCLFTVPRTLTSL